MESSRNSAASTLATADPANKELLPSPPTPRPRGRGRGRAGAPTRGWLERGSEGRKLGKQSPRSDSGKGNASAGGEGRACQPGWRPRAGRWGSGANRCSQSERLRARSRGPSPQSARPLQHPLLGLSCLLRYLLRRRLVQLARRTGGRSFSCLPPSSDSSREPAFSCLPLVGRDSLLFFSVMDWMTFSRAPPIEGRAGV